MKTIWQVLADKNIPELEAYLERGDEYVYNCMLNSNEVAFEKIIPLLQKIQIILDSKIFLAQNPIERTLNKILKY